MATSARRVIRRQRRSRAVADIEAIQELMKSVAEADDELARLKAQRDEEVARLTRLLVAADVKEYSHDGIVVDQYQSPGRATNTVDPREYRNLVSEKEFYDSVTVSVTKAKQYVPTKTLAQITDTKPATPGPLVARVRREKV